jgi:hypothetical protein
MTCTRCSTLLLLVIAAAACDERSAKETSTAAKPADAPPSAIAPPTTGGEESALRLASTGKPPYDDKQILKTAIVSAWRPGGVDGVKHEELVAAVTVYDPRNRKCWAWKKVTYRRSPPATEIVQHVVSHEDADIAEVPCASVGFTPPTPSKKSARRSSSGCRRGEKMCGANCTNTSTDRMNCGACGHECTGDKFACNNGQCW